MVSTFPRSPKVLSSYPAGSIRELFSLSFPLMLTVCSGTLMLFADRLILTRYCIDEMPAAAMASNLYAIFAFGTIGITAISEVFVGRYNGASDYQRLGEPVWQMLWIAVASILLFIPLALFAGPFFIQPPFQAQGVPYFQKLMLFGPIHAMIPALAGFFIGQGKTYLVLSASIIANIFNLLANFLLVFGFSTYIPQLGTQGSAIATILAQLLHFLILLFVFLNATNRKTYGTGKFNLNLETLFDCLKIGFPNTISHVLEISGWWVLLSLVAGLEDKFVKIFSIGQSIFFLFAFISDGLQKGTIAAASNYIGAVQWHLINKVFFSGIKLSLMLSLLFAIPLFIYPSLLIGLFFKENTQAFIELYPLAQVALRWIGIFCIFDMIAWAISGILTAAGDTRFLMFINPFSIWVFSIAPTYLYVNRYGGNPIAVWIFTALYAAVNMVLVYFRYKSNKWKLSLPIIK